MIKLAYLDRIMEFSVGDIVAMVVAAATAIYTYGSVRARNATNDRRLNEIEESVKEHKKREEDTDKFLAALAESMNSLVTRLTVLEVTVKDSREDRLRYHTEVQVALSEIRKDQTRMLSAMAQMQNVKRPLSLPDMHD